MIAARKPVHRAWPFTVQMPEPLIMAHEITLDSLTSRPRHVRDEIETYTSGYGNGRKIGGTLSPELVAACRMVVAAADDLAALAQKELDAIPAEEKKKVWREVKKLRRLEEQAHQKGASQ